MRLACLLICLVSFTGCSTHTAPVSDRSVSKKSYKQRQYKRARIHIVKKGETLFSIAHRYGVDFHRLAVWNGVDRNYSIYPGQRLRLTAPPRKRWRRAARNSGKKHSSDRSTRKTGKKTTRRRATELPGVTRGKVTWRWPTNGRVVKRFSWGGGGKKGIIIAGRRGQPVVAAADGVVIYAGSGILRFGNLLIIRHNEHFLSTYAHNRKIVVKRGVKVKAGQKVADMGSTGTDSPELHFEIRYRGKPVNPERYLPRRK